MVHKVQILNIIVGDDGKKCKIGVYEYTLLCQTEIQL